jgi:hypothetical protein
MEAYTILLHSLSQICYCLNDYNDYNYYNDYNTYRVKFKFRLLIWGSTQVGEIENNSLSSSEVLNKSRSVHYGETQMFTS